MAITVHEDRPAGRHAAIPSGSLFRRIYAPRASDALAFSMSTYAMPLLVLTITSSASLTGLAFALEWTPRIAAFVLAGNVVDRRGAAIVCFLASLGRATVVGVAAVALIVLPRGSAETAVILVLAAVTGTLSQFGFVANEAVGAVVTRRGAARPHGIQAVLVGIDQTATVIGPLLAGFLLLAGPGWMLGCLSAVSLFAAVLGLQTPPTPLRAASTNGAGQVSGLRKGMRTLLKLPALGWLVAGLTCSNLALGLLQSASPVIVVETFHRSSASVGTMWSAAAVATLLAITCCRLVLSRLDLWAVGVVSATLASAACLAVPQAPSYASYTILVAIFMAGDGGLTVVLRTVRSVIIPSTALGATLSLTMLILLLPFPAAGVLVALTPPAHLGRVLMACAVVQAVALIVTFTRLRKAPALRLVADRR
ncbi:MFS transporter [Streptomyces griseorubiginosus]|uniref:MFS transporter n=1 Tax=Streptomyces griseorubiginosus TaxID=67304 RepID=UPI001AD74F1E|nr:MFS transporter [Streptomyces griseorubiginosus]MBO4252700.1 MFS transporter [Streptomyces griseorubiginosus]